MALALSFRLVRNDAQRVLRDKRRVIRGSIPKIIRKTIRRIRKGTEANMPKRTGSLLRSFVEHVGERSGVYGSKDPKARWLEFGTKKMRARRMLHPVFERETRRLPDKLLAEINRR